jgi:hypothetical protein
MKKLQRSKYEMFVRVRDFGTAQSALFPKETLGGQAFARVLAATTAIEEHLKDHVLSKAAARSIKVATREAVFNRMRTIAVAARRVTRAESTANPFVMPKRRSLAGELSTARAFMQAAVTRQAEFEKFGLPPTFVADFGKLVEQLQEAADDRLNAKTSRRKAQAGIRQALVDGLDAVRDLDVVVAIATRESDPVTFAAWTAARQIEGQNAAPAKAVVAPIATPPAPVPAPREIGDLEKAS